MVTLKRRGASYHARLYVPADVASQLGRSEISRTLQTACYREALDRAARLQGRLAAIWAQMRNDPKAMTRDSFNELVDAYLQAAIDEAEEYIANSRPLADDDKGRNPDWDAWTGKLQDDIEETEAAIRFNRYESVEELARGLLKGAALQPSDAEFKILCRRLLQARHAALWAELRGLQGHPMPRLKATQVAAQGTPQVPPKATPKLSEVAAEYGRMQMSQWKPRSSQMGRKGLQFFIECVSDKPIGEVTRADLREYQAKLREQPGRRGVKLSDASVTKLQTYVTGLFRWAMDGEILSDNPAPTILKPVRAALSDEEQRDAFTDEDLKVVFGGDFRESREERPERYWIPLLMLYTGARNEEIAQLHVCDVREVEGVWAVDINMDTPDKTLKNRFSKRIVPLHSALIDAGLLRYVDSMRSEGSARLWPALRKGTRGYNAPVSRWFNRRLAQLGIKTARKDSYSLRHTFSTKLKRAGIPEYVIDQLTGHKTLGMSAGRYGKNIELGPLREQVERLQVPVAVKS
jgi:integrase